MLGILHIGAEKTGSTALQEFFHANRDAMRAAGIFYPESPGRKQHSLLAHCCMDEARENLATRSSHALAGPARGEWKARFLGAFHGELEQHREASTLLVSSELFHSQLRQSREIQRLKDLLDAACSGYRVVVYMRRQDELATSLYSTSLRTGGREDRILGPADPMSAYFNYETLLDRWAEVFGAENIIPRLFGRRTLAGRDIVADFLSATLLPLAREACSTPAKRNAALSLDAQKFLLAYNRSMAREAPGRQAELRRRRLVVGFLESGPAAAPARPSQSEARAFLDAFRESNAAVARRWFGRNELFDDDFDHYPEVADDLGALDPRTLVTTAAGLEEYLSGQSLWLGDGRLERLLAIRTPQRLLQVMAEYLHETCPDLALHMDQAAGTLATKEAKPVAASGTGGDAALRRDAGETDPSPMRRGLAGR